MILDDLNQSSTAENIDEKFEISYGDSSAEKGFFVKDTVSLGGIEMEAVQFGVANFSRHVQIFGEVFTCGIMGIGADALENSAVSSNATAYPNLVSNMVNQGVIKTRAYSLFLNSLGKAPLYLARCCSLRTWSIFG